MPNAHTLAGLGALFSLDIVLQLMTENAPPTSPKWPLHAQREWLITRRFVKKLSDRNVNGALSLSCHINPIIYDLSLTTRRHLLDVL